MNVITVAVQASRRHIYSIVRSALSVKFWSGTWKRYSGRITTNSLFLNRCSIHCFGSFYISTDCIIDSKLILFTFLRRFNYINNQKVWISSPPLRKVSDGITSTIQCCQYILILYFHFYFRLQSLYLVLSIYYETQQWYPMKLNRSFLENFFCTLTGSEKNCFVQ